MYTEWCALCLLTWSESIRTSSRIDSIGRLLSSPLVKGTMQKLHMFSHPRIMELKWERKHECTFISAAHTKRVSKKTTWGVSKGSLSKCEKLNYSTLNSHKSRDWVFHPHGHDISVSLIKGQGNIHWWQEGNTRWWLLLCWCLDG